MQAGSRSGSSAGSSGGSSDMGTLQRDLVGSGAARADGAVFSPTNQFLDFSFKNVELLGERNREAAQAMAGLSPNPTSNPDGVTAGSSQTLGPELGACVNPESSLEAVNSGAALDAVARLQPGAGANPVSARLGSGQGCAEAAGGAASGAQGRGRRPAASGSADRSADRGHLLARPKRSSA